MTVKSCSRNLNHGITLTFAVLGAAMGVYGYLSYTAHVGHEVPHFIRSIGFAALVVGITVAVLNVIGLIGSIFQNKCLLIIYATLMTLTVILEIGSTVTGLNVENEEKLDNKLKSSLPFYNEEKDVKKFWDMINTRLNCCGVVSVDDWGDNIPNSCCKDLDANDVCHKELANETPCLTSLIATYRKNAPYYIGVVCSVQMISIIISSAMCFYEPETV